MPVQHSFDLVLLSLLACATPGLDALAGLLASPAPSAPLYARLCPWFIGLRQTPGPAPWPLAAASAWVTIVIGYLANCQFAGTQYPSVLVHASSCLALACFASPPACMTELLLLLPLLSLISCEANLRRSSRLPIANTSSSGEKYRRAYSSSSSAPSNYGYLVPHCLPALPGFILSTCPSSPVVDPFFFAPTFFFKSSVDVFSRSFLSCLVQRPPSPVDPPSSSVAATTRHHRADKNKKKDTPLSRVSPHQSILAASRTSERSSCAASPTPESLASPGSSSRRARRRPSPHPIHCHL